MVIKILEMALPVLIMLGLGYFCKAKNVFDEKGLLGLKAFISNITLPVVLFNAFLCAEYNAKIVAARLYCSLCRNVRGFELFAFYQSGRYDECGRTGLVLYFIFVCLDYGCVGRYQFVDVQASAVGHSGRTGRG